MSASYSPIYRHCTLQVLLATLSRIWQYQPELRLDQPGGRPGWFALKMINNLFRSGWGHKDPAQRIRAIEGFSEADPGHQDILRDIAQTDAEARVRHVAIGLLLDCRLLEKQALAQGAAQTRLNFLIQSPDTAHQKQISEYLHHASPNWLAAITSHSPDAKNRAAALARLSDDNDPVREQQLAAVAIESEFSDIRELAVAGIADLELLEATWKQLRKRDKNLGRKLREKLDKNRLETRHRQQVLEQTEKIILAMETLKASVWTPKYKLRYLGLVSQWEQVLPDVNDAQSARYQQAALAVDAVVRQRGLKFEAGALQQQLLLDAKALQEDALHQPIEQLPHQMTQWQGLQQAWQATLTTATPEDAATRQFDQAATFFATLLPLANHQTALDDESAKIEASADAADTDTLQQQTAALEAIIRDINWPKSLSAPAALTALKAQLKHHKAALQERAVEAKARIDAITRQIRHLNSAIHRGDLAMARGLKNKIVGRMALSPAGQSTRLVEQLAKADAALNELADWKEFAIQPKFQELCEKMEALIEPAGGGQAPQQQAKIIKQLQQSWKSLKAKAPDELWQRFQTAGDRAFEPCAAHYAAQDRLKAANLEQRQTIVAELESLAGLAEPPDPEQVDSNQPDLKQPVDWKSLRQQLRHLYNRWRDAAEVDYQQARDVGKRFRVLTRRIEALLQEEYTRNLAKKQALVERAEELAGADITTDTLEAIKQLQGRWQIVGILDRKDDQKVWKAFRHACDEAFDKHRQGIDAERAGEKSRIDAAGKIIQAIKSLAEAPDAARVAQLRQEFHNLPDLPQRARKKLERDLEHALDLVQAATRRHEVMRSHQHLQEMQRRADICAALEWMSDKDAKKAIALRQDWALEPLPADLGQIMEARKTLALKTTLDTAGLEQAGRERRLLCIELEYLLGRNSPAEDKSLRMEYQVALLQSRGLHADAKQDQEAIINDLRLRWYQMPAADKNLHGQLDERFHALFDQTQVRQAPQSA